MRAKKVYQLALIVVMAAALVPMITPAQVFGQDRMPEDNGLWSYYTPPRHRPSESHPLRLVAYALHPVGWLARELVTRPLNYFIASNEVSRSVFGYRQPYDERRPECFSADASAPDCRSISPYNYEALNLEGTEEPQESATATKVERQVYLPDVNFDFDVRKLNDLGQGRVHQIAKLLQQADGVNVVLEGHTDYVGSEGYNEKLGMDRAEAVRQQLLSLGVPESRLSTVTFGKSKPALEDQTNWARAVNRRVEIHADVAEPAPAAKPEAKS
jgi:outer membrane protein OmpA-like peptidoglycan-associated protein